MAERGGDELSGRTLLDGPETEAAQLPMADEYRELSPCVGATQGPTVWISGMFTADSMDGGAVGSLIVSPNATPPSSISGIAGRASRRGSCAAVGRLARVWRQHRPHTLHDARSDHPDERLATQGGLDLRVA